VIDCPIKVRLMFMRVPFERACGKQV